MSHGNLICIHNCKLLNVEKIFQTCSLKALFCRGGGIVTSTQTSNRANTRVRATGNSETPTKTFSQLGVCVAQAILVADVVLRNTLLGEIGCGVRWSIARDAEMSLKEVTGLDNGLFFSRRGDIGTIIVVTAHENEELGACGFILGACADVGIEEDAEGMLWVELRGHGVGDKIAETRRLEVLLREPDVDCHDRDGVCCG
ncbi:hypothetical protein HG530_012804 [Fusarium avenaceum]|nr:hypothetical protein HG530_012804 [Fusarium avenaceum]